MERGHGAAQEAAVICYHAPMQIWDRSAHAWALGGAAVLALFGAAFLASPEPWPAILLFVAAALWYAAHMRRSFRRRRLAREPFPAEWRAVLEANVGWYRRLDPDRRAAFERDVLFFVRENRFVGVEGVEVTDELKVLAAASAVMLLFGRTDREYPRVSEILFYPRAFSDEFRTEGAGRDIAGMLHPYGAVVLSIPELRRSFAGESDGYHVGLHEFAHALDLSSQQCDGFPLGIDPRLVRPWSERLREEMERASRGRGALRPYAGTNIAETFAVAVETFFERPEALKKANPELHALLEEYFGRR
ncbi:MAG: zinc-dependent peptidase [Planctomycetes bacterium]|nr:zinc-dependent peptidase [Planctomycetota bacterium]